MGADFLEEIVIAHDVLDNMLTMIKRKELDIKILVSRGDTRRLARMCAVLDHARESETIVQAHGFQYCDKACLEIEKQFEAQGVDMNLRREQKEAKNKNLQHRRSRKKKTM